LYITARSTFSQKLSFQYDNDKHIQKMPAQANSIAPFWDDRQLAYGHDVRSSQELLEHKDIKTIAIETP
jgi:hypothetical protein